MYSNRRVWVGRDFKTHPVPPLAQAGTPSPRIKYSSREERNSSASVSEGLPAGRGRMFPEGCPDGSPRGRLKRLGAARGG